MRVLFLDCDGVMTRASMGTDNLDAVLVDRVGEVVRRTGCDVVLSSMLRIHDASYNELRRALYHRFGDPFRISDRTPRCAQKIGSLYVGHERGAEIAEWLAAHPEVERFAIVDDTSDMGPLCDRLVQTEWSRGIQPEHVERLVALLTEAK